MNTEVKNNENVVLKDGKEYENKHSKIAKITEVKNIFNKDDEFIKELREGDTRGFCIYDDNSDQVVGYITYNNRDCDINDIVKDEIDIRLFCVRKGYRNKGYGTSLINHLLKQNPSLKNVYVIARADYSLSKDVDESQKGLNQEELKKFYTSFSFGPNSSNKIEFVN